MNIKSCFVFLAMIVSASTSAQSLWTRYHVELPDSIKDVVHELVDLDNDGLKDVLLFVKTVNGEFITAIVGDTVNGPKLQTDAMPVPPVKGYALTDYNLDNQIDIVLSVEDTGGKRTLVYLNTGGFNFDMQATDLPPFNKALFTDLDNNGRVDAIVSGKRDNGSPYTQTLHREGSGWKVRHDTLAISLSSIQVLDIDGNGHNDLFLSGSNASGPVTYLLVEDSMKYKIHTTTPKDLESSVCDIDRDGRLDIVGYGKDASGNDVYHVFSSSTGYAPGVLTSSGRVMHAFWADFNADGIPDEKVISVNASGDTTNVIRFGQTQITFSHADYRSLRIADMNSDGHLDIVQLAGKDKLSLSWFETFTATPNKGPSKPEAHAFSIYDKIFLFWEKSVDDHTPSASVTYDVHIEGVSAGRDGTFDIEKGTRLRSQHGNNGTNNFLLFRNRNTGPISYAIQSIDNALHASTDICIGNGTSCSSARVEKISACTGENIRLSAPANALWFSLGSGLVGEGTSHFYTSARPDTIFYIIPGNGCPALTLFEIEINNNVERSASETMYVCENAEVELEADTRWNNITWHSQKMGALGTSQTIQFTASVSDNVTVVYQNEEGCKIEKTYHINLSKPNLTVGGPYRIMKGQSVQLSASGGEQYEWSPAQGLSQTNVASPVASPQQDTRYVVTAFDAYGCTATAEVLVTIESMAFIPTLFTPNGDGQNDHLKVYGVSGAESFTFRIFNREGSVVYKSTNPSEAAGIGWNGETNGIMQPNGVYYWKVEGRSSSGNKLLLNGKEEGSLVLLR